MRGQCGLRIGAKRASVCLARVAKLGLLFHKRQGRLAGLMGNLRVAGVGRRRLTSVQTRVTHKVPAFRKRLVARNAQIGFHARVRARMNRQVAFLRKRLGAFRTFERSLATMRARVLLDVVATRRLVRAAGVCALEHGARRRRRCQYC